jgi:hypothetical protein
VNFHLVLKGESGMQPDEEDVFERNQITGGEVIEILEKSM